MYVFNGKSYFIYDVMDDKAVPKHPESKLKPKPEPKPKGKAAPKPGPKGSAVTCGSALENFGCLGCKSAQGLVQRPPLGRAASFFP